VHVTGRERERLLIAAAADLARRRIARGAPLGATEAIALVCDEVCEMAWDGVPLEDVVERARAVVPEGALLPGVAGLVPVIEVEALFPWGSTLVHVAAPFGPEQEQRGANSLYATQPVLPDAGVVGLAPGAVLAGAGVVELAPGAARRRAVLRNTGARDVWVSSHFPLDQVNPAVEVRLGVGAEGEPVLDDGRAVGAGLRIDLPAGEALLLPAGEEREVTVVVGG
jgi:urease subunit gamma/beta